MNALESDEVSGSRAFLSRCAVGVFVAFHVIALAQHIMPSSGLGKTFSFELNRLTHASDYMRAISSEQRWGLFSPNPSFANIFVQVLVEVDNGEIVDLRHDIYRNRKHPYLFYDRFGKINRSVYEHPRYRAPYAAWVCRDWALTHGGDAPLRVHLVKAFTRLPPPEQAILTMGFEPESLPLHQERRMTYRCGTLVHGQLPNSIRERYTLPLLSYKSFVDLP